MIHIALSLAVFASTAVWAAPAPQFDDSPFPNSSPFEGGNNGFLSERGPRIAFTIGMVILGLIIASLVFWFIVACCIGGAAIRASNRRRTAYVYGNNPGAMSHAGHTAAMAAHNAASHTAMANHTAAANAAPSGGGTAPPPSYPAAC